ncbi:unannotated protein [freshwater metagenome]|uniref:Unannotated protein n=1 Tax=freshwater metagenome TaxID=449393 RepID=A0A6J6M7R7_9ZZZZ|nr:hypothetical protein [Actinomycetota bacterium]
MTGAHFHPQRLHPRYGGLVNIASQLPGGLALASKTCGRFIFDQQPSSSENPSAADLEAAVVAVCGFPRTGTTYLQEAASQALGAPERCWKNHDPFSIPVYIDAGLLTLIPLRDPISTISSWSVYNNDLPSLSIQRNRLLSYTAWHRAIQKYVKSPHVMLVGFDSLGDSSDELLDSVREMNEGQELLLHMQNFPSEIREELKAPYVEALNDPKLSGTLFGAFRVYENLMRETVALVDVEIATTAAAAAAAAAAA